MMTMDHLSNLPTVSAADLVRHFGDWQDQARVKPIVVTRHGKSTHALLAYEQYEALSGDVPAGPSEIERCKIALFDESITATFILSGTLHILAANRAAATMSRREVDTLIGLPFAAIFPEVGNDLLHRYIRRTAAAGEHLSADAIIAGSGRWVHFKTYQSETGVMVTLRDTTDDVAERHNADVKAALIAALECDGGIGHARISLREMVDQASPALIDMLGISEEAFRRVKFSTVISSHGRVAFCDALERVFTGHGPQRIETSLVDRDGRQIPVCLSIVELRGDYTWEGAIVLVTRLRS